ncbi:hypothetical protein JCM19300_896 [Algibacter lectus]|uniref:Uncharacterized protein n=1 Tax=Algibacter lectus TaxID=221126 RepID=A0A090VHK9_9FLAO|nr:hypothetical protein JCM19300_896 [Algibacter lectus]
MLNTSFGVEHFFAKSLRGVKQKANLHNFSIFSFHNKKNRLIT